MEKHPKALVAAGDRTAGVLTPGGTTGGGVLAVVAAASILLSACGSSGSNQASAVVKDVCGQVSAVLADGPDPGADPVGYAEAQIAPLGQIHTSDTGLQRSIDDLDSAYRKFFRRNGATAAKRAVSRASDKVDAVCPGATS